MELQETLLHTTMDIDLVQEIKIMTQQVDSIVHSIIKVPGGIEAATGQTSMGSTILHALCGVMG